MKAGMALLLVLLTAGLAEGQSTARTVVLGTNLSSVVDYSSELPFVDLMHSARVWYTKDAEDPEWDGPWNTEMATQLAYRTDGYPTYLPQKVASQKYAQRVATIWGETSAWPEGTWVVLWEGKGKLSMGGQVLDVTSTSPNRLTFRYQRPAEGQNASVELVIETSDLADPVRRVRVLMPGTEATSEAQPFNPLWLKQLRLFSTVRFMDWGATNGWGQPDPWTWDDKTLFSWKQRATLDHYTWADGRGVPYEMMIRLMNEQQLDGWVCVPHRADPGYIAAMAALFHAQVDPRRKLTVEYSNELWNWMFGQAQWLKKYGRPGVTWPENITGNIQDCLDTWTKEYGKDLGRLTRVVGLQTGWLDVSQRIAFNLRPGSFDAVAPAYYFGLSEAADASLDALGAKATVADVANAVRKGWEVNEKPWMTAIHTQLAAKLGLPMVYYEGGQHLTPTPFGQEPTYAAALLAIQRDPVMAVLYREWLAFVKTLGRVQDPLVLMNFAFVGGRSAQYGSWGILESLDQDFDRIPAPKYQVLRELMGKP